MTEPRLPPRERAKRYRELAGEARGRAAKSNGEMRAAFTKIAGQWDQFVLEAEEAEDESRN